MKQPIHYIMRPDPSTLFPTPLHLAEISRNAPLPWTENKCPEVIIKGDIFRQVRVEVRCKVGTIPKYNYLSGS